MLELYVNWKSYFNSFNSWIDKKDISISALAVLFGILIGITQFCNRIKILYITRMK